ncbi:trypsin-like serine peptidase [Pseudobdellovibrio exovorus]|uniref:Serine protease n=1 Tax=Pseudobdellovibrio exovorus JSS TaxID=1184267 RepID=M4VCL8_9BACT|nr:serine protease [Pseudobdellovibrio exovorus]AGH95781.1 hypothetical protein A11Q_1565 [Pseudobdellovibrio exovorus JSS]
MKSILMTALITLVSVTASAQINPDLFEKIIDKNDLVMVDAEATNVPRSFAALVDAFGYIDIGCTATHIGHGYVLTAGHCFWANLQLKENQDCSDVSISWGFRQGKEPYMVSKCESIVAMQDNESLGSDFAIMKVSPVPPVKVDLERRRRIIAGNRVTAFSHADDQPLQWSKYCFVQPESAYNQFLPKKAIQHKCDTNPSSSGAVLIDVFTKKIVGIHNGGVLIPGPAMNYGTHISEATLSGVLDKLGF